MRTKATAFTTRQTPRRKRKPRTPAQEELFGTGNPNSERSPELGREIARLRRDYNQIEESWRRVVNG